MTRFEICVGRLLLIEGGYVNDPKDPGGETKYGISKRSYPHLDIANLTANDAVAIYHRDFWNKCSADRLPVPLDAYLFDSAVNQGPGYAIRALQGIVGTTRDGILGPLTLRALGRMGVREAGALFLVKRAFDYAALATYNDYGRGWIKRLFLVAADG